MWRLIAHALIFFFFGAWVSGSHREPPPPAPKLECPAPPPAKKCVSTKDVEGVLQKFQDELFYCLMDVDLFKKKILEQQHDIDDVYQDLYECRNRD